VDGLPRGYHAIRPVARLTTAQRGCETAPGKGRGDASVTLGTRALWQEQAARSDAPPGVPPAELPWECSGN